MTDQHAASVSFEVPFNLAAWQIISGAEPCESCATPVAVTRIEDDDGRLTGERRLCEVVDRPDFGREHTPDRCRSARHSRETTRDAS